MGVGGRAPSIAPRPAGAGIGSVSQLSIERGSGNDEASTSAMQPDRVRGGHARRRGESFNPVDATGLNEMRAAADGEDWRDMQEGE